MKSKNSIFSINRELKIDAPAQLVKKVEDACKGYGNRQIFCQASNVSTQVLHLFLKEKKATASVIERIESGLKLIRTKRVAA